MQDVFPIKRVDHLELYVGNAKQAAAYYTRTLGFAPRGYRGLETGTRDAVSYLLDQGQVRLIVTGALTPDHAVARSRKSRLDPTTWGMMTVRAPLL